MTCAKGCCETQAEHYRSIGISANALPTRRPGVAATSAKDAALAKDLDAYKRLRHNGTQPRGIDGSAALEQRAESSLEIEMGPSYVKGAEHRIEEARELMAG